MVSKNLSGIKDLTGLLLPILELPKIFINPIIQALTIKKINLQIEIELNNFFTKYFIK